MESGELTIVTGFFDCGRGEHQTQGRSNQDYLDYFEKWARIQNKLVVYTTKEFKEIITKIRTNFERQEQTRIIVIDELEDIEPELLNAMKKVEDNKLFCRWRARDYDVSNLALYNYIMMMKYWMLLDATVRFPEVGMVAWLDFGWNHGGKVFPNEEEFDFLWKYDFDEYKVHLFARKNPEEEIGFLKLQTMTDGIMGSPVICGRKTVIQLYDAVKEAMWSLLSLDAMDDDQMLLTMAYKRYPWLFDIHDSDWFLPMKEFGGGHLTVKNIPEGKKNLKRILMNVKRRGIFRSMILFYIQYIKKSTEERYWMEKRIHNIFKEYL